MTDFYVTEDGMDAQEAMLEKMRARQEMEAALSLFQAHGVLMQIVRQGDVDTFRRIMDQADSVDTTRPLINLEIGGISLLKVAIIEGHTEMIRFLMSADGGRRYGLEVFPPNDQRGKPISSPASHVCLVVGRLDLLKVVLECCINEEERVRMLNIVDVDGSSLLHTCVQSKRCENVGEVIEFLLSEEGRSRGFTNVFQLESQKQCNFLFFVRDLPQLRAILSLLTHEERTVLLNQRNEDGATVLFAAILTQKKDIVQFLLSDDGGKALGFSAILGDGIESSPLHAAIVTENEDIIQVLLDRCTKEEVQQMISLGDESTSILAGAAKCKNPKILPLILQAVTTICASPSGSNNSSSIEAKLLLRSSVLEKLVSHRRVDQMAKLMEAYGSNTELRKQHLNVIGEEGFSLLLKAIYHKSKDLAQWFLTEGRAAGFDLFTHQAGKEVQELNCLSLAAVSGQSDIFFALIEGLTMEEKKVLVSAVDSRGITLLHLAAKSNQTAIIDWLLSENGGRKCGFDSVCAVTVNNLNAIAYAASGCRGNAVEFFFAIMRGATEEEKRTLMTTKYFRGRNILFGLTFAGAAKAIEWILDSSSPSEDEASSSSSSPSSSPSANKTTAPGSGRYFGFDDLLCKEEEEQYTILQVAVQEGHLDIFRLILAKCISPAERQSLLRSVTNCGFNLLHTAVRYRRFELIEEIMSNDEWKWMFNAVDNRGMTPLQRIIIGGFDKESQEEWTRTVKIDIRMASKERIVRRLLGLQNATAGSNNNVSSKDTINDAANDGEVEAPVVMGVDPNVPMGFNF